MIGFALYNSEGAEPFIVAQTKSGKWVWVDENAGTYGLMNEENLRSDYHIADSLPKDLVQESLEALKQMLPPGMTLEAYIANN